MEGDVPFFTGAIVGRGVVGIGPSVGWVVEGEVVVVDPGTDVEAELLGADVADVEVELLGADVDGEV